MSIKDILIEELANLEDAYRVCGIIDKNGCIYPLGADTKVLSSIFELVSRPAVYRAAERLKMEVVEPSVQNHYPDFTLVHSGKVEGKIAIDVKTTYRDHPEEKFGYTLGGYTSFIRETTSKKNIVFPFKDYSEHWVIGFVYDRIGDKKSQAAHSYRAEQIEEIALPFENVESFVQEKWKISSDRAGSGNTTNIGSITARLEDFAAGAGQFESEEEFLRYWRNYEKTKALREQKYSNIAKFRTREKW